MKAILARSMFGLLPAALLAACSVEKGGAHETTDVAQVTGQLQLAAYGQLQSPTIVAQHPSGAIRIAQVGADGRFTLTLPSDEIVRLSIAEGSTGGALVDVSRIRLPGLDGFWAQLSPGARLDLGTVHPAGSLLRKDGHSGSGGDDAADDSDDHGLDGSDDAADGSDDHGLDGSDDDGSDDRGGDDDGDDHGGDFDVGDDCHRACVPERGEREADLPYAVRLAVGDTFTLADAFALEGGQPDAVVRVTMEGDPWHLDELTTGTPFTVTDADCTHEGNRDEGRDRIYVTWQNSDGSVETDHLDLRYCDGSDLGGERKHGNDDDDAADDDCAPGETPSPVCSVVTRHESECDGGSVEHVTLAEDPQVDPVPVCDDPGAPPTSDPSDPSVPGDPSTPTDPPAEPPSVGVLG